MGRTAGALVTALLLGVGAYAQRFAADGGAFVWRNGAEYIRYEGGRWTAGMDNAGAMNWTPVLWHDDWVYETVAGGPVAAGPTLTG
ncbi:MAG: hypothetical protein FJ280_30905, partial [Planctomycetes bacterium]|nr:hypothetical protein [Planctomycetota bacterium]